MKICPLPPYWATIHGNLIAYAKNRLCNPPEPPKPLILAGWSYSTDDDKRLRWLETERWAKENGCSDLINGLEQKNFYHNSF